jgi:ferritin-like metal-binding protein YciE
MKENNTLRELFVDELRDLLDAENRLLKAIPKMAKASESAELRAGFEHHLEQTKGHVERLKKVFTALEEKPSSKKCPGITGIIQEGDELIGEGYEGSVKDAAIISAAQRVEHYEIAAYGCVHAWATELGEDDAAELLSQTLEEEKATDAKLTELAGQINTSAVSDEEEADAEEEEESEDEELEHNTRKGKSANA